jgi:hypothetical protein
MKRKGQKEEVARTAAPHTLSKEQEALSGKDRQLLKAGNSKRATFSPALPHSRTFGH